MKKTKEEKEINEEVSVPVKKTSKSTTKTVAKKETKKSIGKTASKKTTAKSTAKSTTAKKTAVKDNGTKSDEKKATTKATKTASKKTATKSTTAKKSAVKDAGTKSDEKKIATKTTKTASKKTATKSTAKSTTAKKSSSKNVVIKTSKTPTIETSHSEDVPETLKEVLRTNDSVIQAEYYDLPYRYNETTIKILAQSPHSLFLYWDVSDNDRANFIKKYGENFFYDTKPVLLVHNKTQNYSFEVEVDDFTNSWYLRTPTSDCVFDIELARKDVSSINKYDFQTQDNRLHISDSNILKSPNDHILIETLNQPITFKNIQTNKLEERLIKNTDALKNYYKDFEVSNEVFNNPSSDFRI